jgi:hypothetical protein
VSTKKKKIILVFSLAALTFSAMFFWKTSSTSGITNGEEFNQKIRNSMAEVNLPRTNDSAAITTASESFSNYVYYRSGVNLGPTNKSLLRQIEQNAWNQSKKISNSQLAQILTDVAFEKLVTLTDSDINNMAETLRGFNDRSLPAVYQNGRTMVRLRANGEGSMEPQYFVSQLISIRNTQTAYSQNPYGGRPPLVVQSSRAALYNGIVNEISACVSVLKAADPNFFGDPTTASKGLTPMQAMLVAYSVISDDMLVGNEAELRQKMSILQQTISQYWATPYPSPQGRRAYGTNGYIYSSPTNYLLDEASVARILNLINERSNLQ